MDKRGPMWSLGGIAAFVGLTGRRDDLLATVEHIDLLGLPSWLDWSLVLVGIALISYAVFWPKAEAHEPASDHDRDWTEDGAIRKLEIQQAHSQRMMETRTTGLAIILCVGFISVALSTCERIPSGDKSLTFYRECLKHSQSAEGCQAVLEMRKN